MLFHDVFPLGGDSIFGFLFAGVLLLLLVFEAEACAVEVAVDGDEATALDEEVPLFFCVLVLVVVMVS